MKIVSLKLKNFRQFKNQTFEFDPQATVISGENTKGKSTILEAVYLLMNGKFLTQIENGDVMSTENSVDKYFSIEGVFDTDGEEGKLIFYHDGEKNQLTFNGKIISKRKFLRLGSCNLFSPEQIDFLMYSSAKRRDFLNDLISRVDDEYASELGYFEKSLRQRNAYLKKLSKKFYESGVIDEEDQQLNYWSEVLAEHSANVMSKRADILNLLSDKLEELYIEYQPAVTLNLFEDLARKEELQEIQLKQLKRDIRKEVALGHTTSGAHRDDWQIRTDKDVKRFGSRGEKRTALGRLIFKTQEIYLNGLGYYPILLLDDIASELDDKNLNALISHKAIANQQVIITTINRSEDITKWLHCKPKLISLD